MSLTKIQKLVAATAVSCCVAVGVAPAAHAAPRAVPAPVSDTAASSPVLFSRNLTQAQRAQLGTLTDTPQKQEKFLADLRASFGGLGSVGAGSAQPDKTGSSDPSTYLAQGWDRDHWWVTASYGDIARGAITAAVAGCKTRLPGWLCTTFGNVIRRLAAGQPALENHGVWAAVYIYGRVDGGRW